MGMEAWQPCVDALTSLGNGRFQNASRTCDARPVGTLLPGDWNGDRRSDVITMPDFNLNNTLPTFLSGNGDGTYRAPLTLMAQTGAGLPVVGDIDRDGNLDAVGAANGLVIVFLGNGDGTLKLGASYPSGNNPYSPVLADIDGDGWLDVVVADAYKGNPAV